MLAANSITKKHLLTTNLNNMKTAMQQLIDWTKEPATMYSSKSIIARIHELLEVEKQQLIDAVNSHDKDCINTANNVVSLIKPSAPKEFFTYDGKAGTEYYNKTFTKQ